MWSWTAFFQILKYSLNLGSSHWSWKVYIPVFKRGHFSKSELPNFILSNIAIFPTDVFNRCLWNRGSNWNFRSRPPWWILNDHGKLMKRLRWILLIGIDLIIEVWPKVKTRSITLRDLKSHKQVPNSIFFHCFNNSFI